jgi:hypothetical protein
MATSKPVTWLVSDIINWYKSKELIINESFQRHSVWPPQAKTMLIDSILSELPIPKIYIRTRIDAKLQKAVKEIVDGQQRIRSIVEFANNEYTLSSKSEKYSGLKYSDLSPESQELFLGYIITADHLLNATDDDVIDIFARLNSYTVALNAAEKRHAAYQTELKFFVRRLSIKYRWFIEKYGIFTTKQRFRMADDEFIAELVRLVVEGIQDGGSERMNKFYDKMTDKTFDSTTQKHVEDQIDRLLNFLDIDLGFILKGPLGKHYQIYALSAAYLHIFRNIKLDPDLPDYQQLASCDTITEKLLNLEKDLENEIDSAFVKASSSSTQRIASRRIRIGSFIEALGV